MALRLGPITAISFDDVRIIEHGAGRPFLEVGGRPMGSVLRVDGLRRHVDLTGFEPERPMTWPQRVSITYADDFDVAHTIVRYLQPSDAIDY